MSAKLSAQEGRARPRIDPREPASGEPDEVALLWASPASEQVVDRSPLLWAQQFVATEAHDQATPARRLEHREDRVGVGREQQTIPQQVPPRVGTDQVKLTADRDAMPVGELEMI